MPATLDALSQDALVLPPDQRVCLAYRLLVSVEPDPIAQAVGAWSNQCQVFTQRASRGNRQKFEAALSKSPAAPPQTGDE